MITNAVRWGLRLIAVVALILLCVLIVNVTSPKAEHHAIKPRALPTQQYTAPDDYTLAPFKYDDYEVVVPKPSPAVKPQAATPRKPSVANVKPAVPPFSISAAKGYARSKVSAVQFACLDTLWTRESSWNYHALNTASGAYGIPQALPGSKMSSAGADWRDNYRTQVNWGLSYISGRYGTPCAGLAHSNSLGWY